MSEPPSAGVKGTVQVVEPTPAERSVARRSAEARATIPDLELSVEVDMGACIDREAPLTAILIRAAALALREHPRANAAYRDGHFELYSRVNVAVTMPQLEGQVAATLFDADRKGLRELASEVLMRGLKTIHYARHTFDLQGSEHRATQKVIRPDARSSHRAIAAR